MAEIISDEDIEEASSHSSLTYARTLVEMNGYRLRSREILQLIDKLRDEGISHEIDLPIIVFCGNQSSGKSSLIEAISAIRLPRAAGTCTRCAMEVRMIDSDEPWSCCVLLQYKYTNSGAILREPYELLFKEDICDLFEVELAVRRAQKAILNPKANLERFQTYNFEETHSAAAKAESHNELKFTANTVLIKIKGSGFNLTLVDLPGIIRTTERRGEKLLIKLVEDMVKFYIKNPRSLIVATISCKDEVENQAVLALASEADPEGVRTIGVLTKPDTIESECHESWLEILSKKRFELNLGYFIVKNPDKQDLSNKIDFLDARNKEKKFFNDCEPWSKCSLALKSRMGVDNLRKDLSKHLTEMIEKGLGSIRMKINELLDDARAQLSELPTPFSKSPKLEIIILVKKLDARLKALATASSHDKDFYHKISERFAHFSYNLFLTRPVLVLPVSNKPKGFTACPKFEEFLEFGEPAHSNEFGAERVQKIIHEQRGREFSQFLKHEALQEIIRICQTGWERFTLDCLKEVARATKKAFAEEIDQHFGKWPTLARKVQLAVDSFITQVTNMTTPKVLESCNIETSFPITWDSQRFDEVVAKIHFYLEQALNPLSTEQNTAPKFRSIYSLFDFGDSVLNLNNKRPQAPGSLHENVIKIMEMAQAYYSIARSRFGDNIPMIIYHNLVHQLSNDTESYLFEALGFTNAAFTDDDCLKLLEEKPHVLAKRKELNARISHLEEIHSKVFSESISANF